MTPHVGQLIRRCINGVPYTLGPARLSLGVWEVCGVHADGTVDAFLGPLTRLRISSWVSAAVGSAAWATRASTKGYIGDEDL